MAQSTARSSVYTRPYDVRSIDQLPPDLLNIIKDQPLSDTSIEGIFVVPAHSVISSHRGHQTPLQSLIFTNDGVLHVAESPSKDETGKGQWILAEKILFIKLSLILLYGMLEIWFLNADQILNVEVEFNTVGYSILSPMLHALLRKTWKNNYGKYSDAQLYGSIADLYSISFSFYNGLMLEGFQEEERILGHVYQPEIKMPWLKVFHRSIAPQTAIALTDQQVIFLQQDLKYTKHHEEWIFTFCPLYRILKANIEDFDPWQKLTIQLTSSSQPDIAIILESPNAQRWKEIWGKLNVLSHVASR